MSDCEKKALIFKWPKETEPLKTLLLAFALLCSMKLNRLMTRWMTLPVLAEVTSNPCTTY